MQELASKYDILKVIGHGGFSAVFKARSKENPEKVVALKQLDVTIDHEGAKEYKDFKEEVEILKKLKHPNIVKIYNEYIFDNKPSLEMEFVDGETLEAILKRKKYFSIEETLEVIDQISSALQYCHHYHIPDEISSQTDSVLLKRNAIIHNDINTKNIIRTKNLDGSVRYVLLDFGLSFTDPDAVRHSKKEDGMAEYKAPEKWTAANVDTPSDIYSFGIVIYELLTGTVPFPVKDYKQASEMLDLEEKHKRAGLPNLCERRMSAVNDNELVKMEECDIPWWLESLVKKCLMKNPSERFITGRELSEYYFNGLDGKIEPAPNESPGTAINIDPASPLKHKPTGAFLEVVPNILTEAQHFFLDKDFTTIGRRNEGISGFSADFSLKTADKFISKNHCQIMRQPNEHGGFIYKLQDAEPSKNGTYYNTAKNTQRIPPGIKILLKDGDYFWIGNTKMVFHEPS